MHIELGLLGLAEATELLARLSGTGRALEDPVQLRRLAVLCDRLPLALRIVAARLAAAPLWPVEMLADQLADENSRLDALSFGDLTIRSCLDGGSGDARARPPGP